MGKPLVQVAPTHLSHLGHPKEGGKIYIVGLQFFMLLNGGHNNDNNAKKAKKKRD